MKDFLKLSIHFHIFACLYLLQENFSLLLEVLSDKLHAEGLLLTVAVCADPDIAKESYDFQKVGQWV
jgi:hypothetical protein